MNRLWNTCKTVLLLGGLTGLFLFIGSAVGGQTGMILAFVLAIAMNMGAWWFSDKLALRMSNAREVTAAEMPELHKMVDTLAQRAQLPKPRVYLIDSDMPNAFATGRSPSKGAVAVTSGIMRMLDRDELAGVIAHELAHIKNRDTLISSVAATVAGAIAMLADIVMWGFIFGGFGGSDEEEGGGIGELVGGFLTLILAPIGALLIQMAISRSREYSADADGAKILGNPLPLASALEKLEATVRQGVAEVKPATSHLYIVNPVLGGLGSLFRTHPQTAKRVAALRAMAQQQPELAARAVAG
ncbi:MAG TPA: zinc metalloprotease HtpX [Caldilineaceae bacterium]|nr:zinc metalloprotease HtpX [Caldilineaceae bacterium]